MKPTKKPCKHCKRPTLNANQYCDEHQEKEPKRHELYDSKRESPSKRGYDHKWRKFRAFYLGENPFCMECRKHNKITPAWEVHHIVALANGGERLNPDNCMALCKSCHSKITMTELQQGVV